MPVISRYFIRETTFGFLAVVAILLSVLVGSAFVRLLSQVADGRAGAEVLFPLLGLSTVTSLPVLLSVSLFLAILVTLGRLYADNEITALRASGMGLAALMKPFVQLGLVVAMVQAVLVFWLAPEAEQEIQLVRARSVSALDLGGITPGRFITLKESGQVVYAELLDQERRELQRIFLFSNQDGKNQVISATTASQAENADTGDKYLRLENGQWLAGDENSLKAQRTRFEALGLFIPEMQVVVSGNKPRAMDTPTLWASDSVRLRAELQWRLAAPVMVLVLVLLAIPLSYTSPRKGRFANLAMAVVSCIVYFNVLGMAKGWMMKGVTPAWLGIWWVHFLPLMLATWLLWRQRAFDGLLSCLHISSKGNGDA
ncbi:MAG: LPS export ABC transporter permease LptF [bacterium]